MLDILQVVTTTEAKTDALRIASALVEHRLAACVQVLGPITSTFRWEGKVQTAEEWMCVVKTRARLVRAGGIRDSRAASVSGAGNRRHACGRGESGLSRLAGQ